MKKVLTVSDIQQLHAYESTALESMHQSIEELLILAESNPSEVVFARMKFGGVGCDPLDPGRQLNLIEQINQSFTYLASFLATEVVFTEHPDLAPFRLNLGTVSGSDIESECGDLAAEVFASVTPKNNQKLKKDIDKVATTDAGRKYAFFMCPGYDPGRQDDLERDGVIVWALKCPN